MGFSFKVSKNRMGVYGHYIKLATPFYRDNIIQSENITEKMRFKPYTLNQDLFLTN
jgi:hypothetical protein